MFSFKVLQGTTAWAAPKAFGAGKPSLLEAFAASALQCSECKSHPVPHLLRERALRAIGIVLHAKVFVDLEQPLLVRGRA